MNLSLKRHKDTRFIVTNRCQIKPMPSSARRSAPQVEYRGRDAADESSKCSSHASQTRPHTLFGWPIKGIKPNTDKPRLSISNLSVSTGSGGTITYFCRSYASNRVPKMSWQSSSLLIARIIMSYLKRDVIALKFWGDNTKNGDTSRISRPACGLQSIQITSPEFTRTKTEIQSPRA